MKNKKLFLGGSAFVALAGFADTLYLTVAHYTDATLPCTFVHGCDIVTRSAFSMVGLVPLALIGFLYYLVVFIALVLHYQTHSRWSLMVVHGITTAGFVVSLYLLGVQAFVLRAFCQYCIFSLITSAVLFAFCAMLFYGTRQK